MHLDLSKLFILSAITMGLAHTITRERIFASLRERLGGKETWLGYLVSCPYCASHYIAFVLVPLTGAFFVPVSPSLGILAPVLSWFLSSILVTVGAAFLRVIFYYADESQGLVRREQRRVEVEVERASDPKAAAGRLPRLAGRRGLRWLRSRESHPRSTSS